MRISHIICKLVFILIIIYLSMYVLHNYLGFSESGLYFLINPLILSMNIYIITYLTKTKTNKNDN